jgi:colanic acid biosynthesis glycosyl transferase WcaI
VSRKRRLLVLNEYYWPGIEATAFLLTELCQALADDFDVTVVTGALHGVDTVAGRTERHGVEIVRVPGTAYDRSKLPLRALNYATYLAGSLLQGLRVAKPDVVMCWTDPPMIADIGLILARRAKAPLLVITQDVFPEIAVQLRRLENPALVSLLRVLVNTYLRRADRVVAIGETMAERLVEKGVARERLDVIPNWVNTAALTPTPRDNPWAREHGLVGKFVVMHSGNVGHAQNLELLVRAVTFLRDLDDLEVVIVGGGARRSEIEAFAARLDADNVRFLSYQPRETLSQSLGSAHVHYVGLAPRLAGFVVPSRLYGVLSVGRPVLVAADPESETARIVEEVGCGLVVPPDRPDRLAGAIRRLRSGELDLEEMGSRGREYVLRAADRDVAIGRYRAVLAGLTGSP